VEQEAVRLIALHGDDAGLIVIHLATHLELSANGRRRWSRLGRSGARLEAFGGSTSLRKTLGGRRAACESDRPQAAGPPGLKVMFVTGYA
jgi:hypothetical protein